MVYGETGIVPLTITIKVKVLMFWIKLIKGDTQKWSFQMYKIMNGLYARNAIKCPWISFVHQTLNSLCLTYIWNTQANNVNPD